MNGKNSDGVLFKEKIILSSIIPLEVAHNLFKSTITAKTLDKERIEEMIFSLISLNVFYTRQSTLFFNTLIFAFYSI